MSTATATQAEQFLAQHGIKFRVVASKRGPGEWNVTFSRKGGGRLKLDFAQDEQPTAEQVLLEMQTTAPALGLVQDDPELIEYTADLLEYRRVTAFFKTTERIALRKMREGTA